jgi:hypothetical protein
MKQCPVCSNSYTDDSLKFCLQDGTPLISLNDPAPNDHAYETPTVVLGEQETVVHSKGNLTGFAPQGPTQAQAPQPKRSNTFLVVLLTVFIMLIIGLSVLAAWLYFQNRKYEMGQNTNQAASPSPKASVKPSPTASNASNTNSAANTSVNSPDGPDDSVSDPERVKSDVQKKLNLWKSLSEARDLQSNLENYADHVDYYRAKNVTRDFIRNDKQKASSLYDSIKIELRNVNIIPDPGGEKATAVFDKEWKFTGSERSSTGKVQQQLKLEKIGGEWLITGEKDLKLYYKN